MNPFKASIRRQLLGWLLIPIIGLWLLYSTVTYVIALDLATNAYDNALADTARSVASRVKIERKAVVVDLPPAARAVLKADATEDFYYQVLDMNGHLIAGDLAFPARLRGLKYSPATGFRYAAINGHRVRIASVSVSIPAHPDRFVIVRVAETLQERDNLAQRILLTVVLPGFLQIPLAVLAVWWGVRQGLAPLTAVRDAVASRSPTDLRPLAVDHTPVEVRPLVHAINDLLVRLQKDLEAQRRFVANAAHQLRTPLAGLSTQTQLALRQSQPSQIHHSLNQIHISARACARLVQQLLTLARVEPGAIAQSHYLPVDLTAVVRKATEELVPAALAHGLDLGYEGCLSPVYIYGESLNLRELAINLIENALNYTKRGGKVTVSVLAGETIDLIVDDNGLGIPIDERERIFERFYRVLGTGVAGSGLGLSIVREIVSSHQAELSVQDGSTGTGTLITVRFPKYTSVLPATPASLAGSSV